MLKIKENVDLKELERFGFKYSKKVYTKDNAYILINDHDCIVLAVTIQDRKILSYGGNKGNIVLYNLIQAGLVEKV